MAKVISIINHKGGVGKTTSSMNMGAALNSLKRKILLIDFDAQANLTQSFGLDSEDKKNIYDSISELTNNGNSNLYVQNIRNGFDLICSSLDLSAIEMELMNEAGREYILKELIEPVKKDYDYILIDCPPSLGVLTVNALTASDIAIIPVQAEYLALKGMLKLIFIIEKVQKRLNKDLKFGGVFINQYDARLNLHKSLETEIKNFLNPTIPKASLGVFRRFHFALKVKNRNSLLSRHPKRGSSIEVSSEKR